MRVASFNLFSGRALTDGRVVTARLTRAVELLGADVLGIQEVDRAQPRSDRIDMTGVVADAMGGADHRFVPALTGTPGQAWLPVPPGGTPDPASPAYGVGLVSRLPVDSWHEFRLPAAPVRSPVVVPSPDGGRPRPLLLRDEPRVAVAAVVAVDGRPLTVATTHLSFVPGWNLVQLQLLVRRLAALPGPVLLVGDLNLPGGLPSLAARGWRNVAHGQKTYPAPAPRVQFDHAFARGDIGVPRASSVELPISDHRALVIDL